MSETFTPDNLLVTNVFPVVVDKATIASGQSLKRGTCLGKVTASGKCKTLDKSKSDGQELIYAILCDDVDATSADVEAPVYLTGEFNQAALIFASGSAYSDFKDAARKLGIFFKSTQA